MSQKREAEIDLLSETLKKQKHGFSLSTSDKYDNYVHEAIGVGSKTTLRKMIAESATEQKLKALAYETVCDELESSGAEDSKN